MFTAENEIAIMKHCHHPNIVRLIEEFETEDEIYLVLEYVKVALDCYVIMIMNNFDHVTGWRLV